MRKPFQTGSMPDDEPNEPKIYPGDDGIKAQPGGKANSKNQGYDSNMKGPGPLSHKTVSIPSEHIFGKKASEGSQMHSDPKSLSPHSLPNFAGRGKLPSPKSVSIKPRLPKPKV